MNKNIYVKKINTIGNYAVWLMDGALIRKEINENFVKCADNNQFGFVPKNEFWIEQALSPKERNFIILHELHERYLMSQGKSYKNAHIGATEVEDYYRENPKEDLEVRIKEEMRKNE